MESRRACRAPQRACDGAADSPRSAVPATAAPPDSVTPAAGSPKRIGREKGTRRAAVKRHAAEPPRSPRGSSPCNGPPPLLKNDPTDPRRESDARRFGPRRSPVARRPTARTLPTPELHQTAATESRTPASLRRSFCSGGGVEVTAYLRIVSRKVSQYLMLHKKRSNRFLSA